MSDEELAAIRERVKEQPYWSAEYAKDAFKDRDALLAEVDRLRAENARLTKRAEAWRESRWSTEETAGDVGER